MYQNNAKLCYMDTDSFIIHIKTEGFDKYIADDVKNRYDAPNYETDRPLPKRMNKKVIGLIKGELLGKIVTEFVTLRSKRYSYFTDDVKNFKKAKNAKLTKKCVIKRILNFNDYKHCLFKNQIIRKWKQRFKSKAHKVYIEKINKIALSVKNGKDCKRLTELQHIHMERMLLKYV